MPLIARGLAEIREPLDDRIRRELPIWLSDGPGPPFPTYPGLMPSKPFPGADLWLPPLVENAPVVPAPEGRRPRPLALRFTVGVLTALGSVLVLDFDPWGGDAPGLLHLDRHIDLTVVPGLLLVMAAMSFVLPCVAYRRRDVLMVLVPVYGVWIVGLAFSRLVALPFRDWRPREEERSRLAQVAGSSRYYLLNTD